jgi:hypothetical protein
MVIDLRDEREYAWLLVRSDTLTGELIKVWQSVPIRSGSRFAAALGYPARFVILVASVLLTFVLMLGILIGAAQIPVAIFATLRPILPDTAWLIALGSMGLALAGYLAYAVGLWLQRVGLADEPARAGPLELAAGDDGEAWDRWQSVHVRHESARSGLFAGLSIGIGVVLQCTAVVFGPRYFEGSVETAWAWPVLFGEQLFSTMLLGIPGSVLPTYASIQPSSTPGRLLTVGVDVFYVAGVIAMAVLVLSSAFKVRELFNGTVRDLADYLENFDISSGQRLMIHRVAVLRPLDEDEVVSLSKEAFFELVKTRRAKDKQVSP